MKDLTTMTEAEITSEFMEIIADFDDIQMTALAILLQTITEGKGWRAGEEKAAKFLRTQPEYEKEARLWLTSSQEKDDITEEDRQFLEMVHSKTADEFEAVLRRSGLPEDTIAEAIAIIRE